MRAVLMVVVLAGAAVLSGCSDDGGREARPSAPSGTTFPAGAKPAGLFGASAPDRCDWPDEDGATGAPTATGAPEALRPVPEPVTRFTVCPAAAASRTWTFTADDPTAADQFAALGAAMQRADTPQASSCTLQGEPLVEVYARAGRSSFRLRTPVDGCGRRQPEFARLVDDLLIGS